MRFLLRVQRRWGTFSLGCICLIGTALSLCDFYYPPTFGFPQLTAASGAAMYFGLALTAAILFLRPLDQDAFVTAKHTGIVSFALLPLYLVEAAFLALSEPSSIRFAGGGVPLIVWFNIVFSLLALGASIFIARKLYLDVYKEAKHLSAYAHALFCALCFGLLALWHPVSLLEELWLSGLPMDEFVTLADLVEVSHPALALVLVYGVVGLLALAMGLYVALTTFFSGKERRAIGFRGTAKVTIDTLKRHEIPFYFSILYVTVMLALAIATSVELNAANIGMVITYGAYLAIRIPVHFVNAHIERKGKEGFATFVEKHGLLLYGGLSFVVFVGLTLGFGFFSDSIFAMQRSFLFTYFLFLPWAIIKFVLGVKSRAQAKHSGDPVDLLNAYLDITMAIVTVANALFLAANYLRGGRELSQIEPVLGLFYLFIILFLAASYVYLIVITLKMLIHAIRGMKGKRRKYYDKIHAKKEIQHADTDHR